MSCMQSMPECRITSGQFPPEKTQHSANKYGDITDFIESLESSLAAVSCDSERLSLLLRLGKNLATQHSSQGKLEDIDRAISAGKEALSLTQSGDHPFEIIDGLLAWLDQKFGHTGRFEDLQHCIEVEKELLQSIDPSNETTRSLILNVYGSHLVECFGRRGKISDADMAISTLREALQGQETESGTVRVLTNLAIAHSRRFDMTNGVADFNKCVENAEDALEKTSTDQIKAKLHGIISSAHGSRYATVFATEHLDKAIEHADIATTLTSSGDPLLPMRLNNLSHMYGVRFVRTQQSQDLDKAIATLDTALSKHMSDVHRAYCSANLAAQLRERSMLGSDGEEDLNRSIENAEIAFNLIPEEDSQHLVVSSDLARDLRERYERFGEQDTSDLDRAIDLLVKATTNVKPENQFRAQLFVHLGRAYQDRYRYTTREDRSDMECSIKSYWQALQSKNSQTSTRIKGGREGAEFLVVLKRWSEATDILQHTFDLVPSLSPNYLARSDQQHVVRLLAGLSSMATAVALNMGKEPFEAIEFLERGRGIMASNLMETRMDVLIETTALDSELATQLSLTQAKLEELHRKDDSEREGTSRFQKTKLSNRATIEKELREIIKTIQSRSGLQNLLGLPTLAELKEAMGDDTIVVVNTCSLRSDAFLINKHHGIRLVQLERLKVEDIETHVKRIRLTRPYIDPDLLKWLWSDLAKPILDVLDFHYDSSCKQLPRVCWILAGGLTHLPIHAAGLHHDRSKTVIDRVVSSYSSSLRMYHYGRTRKPQHQTPATKRALLVGMSSTPGYRSLPHAEKEVNKLESLCPKLGLTAVRLRQPDRATVLAELKQSTIFHFAGHGRSDPLDPSNSCLQLGTTSVTIADLRDQNLHQHSPFLGYLSACLTGAHDFDELVDEAIHLITACQVAGFRHVIGTLWQVSDQSCVEVAYTFYKMIAKANLTDESVARGLHEAVVSLRDAWQKERTTTGRGSEADDETPDSRIGDLVLNLSSPTPRPIKSDWVVYVHYGP